MRFIKTRFLNRLWVRITLAFIVITQASLLLVALLADFTIRNEFNRYVIRRDLENEAGVLPDMLTAYYRTARDWQGVEAVFFSTWTVPASGSQSLNTSEGGGTLPITIPLADQDISLRLWTNNFVYRTDSESTQSAPVVIVRVFENAVNALMKRLNVADDTASMRIPIPPRLLVADARGNVVYSADGARRRGELTPDELALAVPIYGDAPDGVVGYLGFSLKDGPFRSPEQDFLTGLRNALLVASGIVGGAGILFGLVLSRTLVAPLGQLARAARAFAGHDWARRVPTKGASEFTAVARAFNEMADELRKGEMIRKEMIADIAHELRTPLTVMQGNLRAILDGVYPMEREEIALIYDETRKLAHLVNDLRELTLADAGKLTPNLGAVHVADLLENTMYTFESAADEKGLALHTETPHDLPPIQADPHRIEQVIRNLIMNAIQHTEKGGITLAAQRRGTEVYVTVSDTGKGIKPDDLPRVFDRFYRGDKSRWRANGGTGLGLAISRAWVEAMGGKIGVESTLGRGSKFWFCLPIAQADTANLPTNPSAASIGSRKVRE
jgi:two-component system OmpR family sensor kinase/two-component system sensor histidine kinase BaeS